MRSMFRTLTLGAMALVLAASVAAQTSRSAPARPAAKAATAKTVSRSAVGTVAKFDAASRTLTIATAKGDQNYVLADKVSLHEGSKVITVDDLGSRTGRNAKVRYTEANGTMRANAVTLVAAKPAKAATRKPGK